MPWENRFIPRVTRSTLPVRSPWPNRQPSTRSAPAITASSVAPTAVPRSLCGCSEMATWSRLRTWRPNHSIWSAYTFGRGHLHRGGQVQDDLATLAGLPDVHHRVADLDGEVRLGAGEDLRRVLVAELDLAQVLLGVLHHQLGAAGGQRHALGLVDPEHDPAEERGGRVVHVDGRGPGARPATRAVRSIRSSRAWVSTETVTSSGIWSPSISCRTKSKSVWLADGKPISISL